MKLELNRVMSEYFLQLIELLIASDRLSVLIWSKGDDFFRFINEWRSGEDCIFTVPQFKDGAY